MVSKASINISAGNCIKIEVRTETSVKVYPFRVVLKQKSFEQWLRRNGRNYYEIACCLGISKQELIRKLKNGRSFSESQIRELTYLMGASTMFFAIYFPTKGERKRVFRESFGYELYEEKYRRKRQRITWVK